RAGVRRDVAAARSGPARGPLADRRQPPPGGPRGRRVSVRAGPPGRPARPQGSRHRGLGVRRGDAHAGGAHPAAQRARRLRGAADAARAGQRARLAARAHRPEPGHRQHRRHGRRRPAAAGRVAAGRERRRVRRPQRRLPAPRRRRRPRAGGHRRAVAGGDAAVIDPALHAVLRGTLAAVLLGAALHKLRDLHAFRVALGDYRLVPWPLTGLVAPLLVAAEVAVGAALLSPWARPTGFAAAAGLVGLYSAAIAVNLLRGRRDIDCGCFGPALRVALGAGLLVRNALLLAAAAAGMLPV